MVCPLAVLDKFCFKFKLKTGVIWIAVVRGLLWILPLTAVLIVKVFPNSGVGKTIAGNSIFIGTNLAGFWPAQAFLVAALASEILLLVGTGCRKTLLFVPWMIISLFLMQPLAIFLLILVSDLRPPLTVSIWTSLLIPGAAFIIIQIYSTIVVLSAAREIESNSPKASEDRQESEQVRQPEQQQQQQQHQHQQQPVPLGLWYGESGPIYNPGNSGPVYNPSHDLGNGGRVEEHALQ